MIWCEWRRKRPAQAALPTPYRPVFECRVAALKRSGARSSGKTMRRRRRTTDWMTMRPMKPGMALTPRLTTSLKKKLRSSVIGRLKSGG